MPVVGGDDKAAESHLDAGRSPLDDTIVGVKINIEQPPWWKEQPCFNTRPSTEIRRKPSAERLPETAAVI